MLSIPEASGDKVAAKLYPLTDRFQWWVMIAADDITHVVPVVEAAVLGMLGLTDSSNTYQNVERIFVSAYQSVRSQFAEDLVLAPIGLNFEELKNRGWEQNLVDRLDSVNLGCEFLVAGFDWSGDGYIFSVGHPGIARNHNVTGYAAIGVGAYNAIGTFLHHSINYEMDLARILYHACEAKFMAESAPGVGKHTVVKVATASGTMDAFEASKEFVAVIRTAWEKDGQPRVPSGIIDELRRQLQKYPNPPKAQ